jgi:large-conductance mechanosensitive channel
MDFNDFLLEYNVVGISMGTIIGYGLTNWVKELRSTIIIPHLTNKTGLTENYGSLTSSSFEVIILIIIMYLMYYYLVIPAINDALEKVTKNKESDKNWKEMLLKSNNNINKKITILNNQVSDKNKITGYNSESL